MTFKTWSGLEFLRIGYIIEDQKTIDIHFLLNYNKRYFRQIQLFSLYHICFKIAFKFI